MENNIENGSGPLVESGDIKKRSSLKLLVISFLVLVTCCLVVYFFIKDYYGKGPLPLVEKISKESNLFSFVRGGDVWVSNFDGKNERRITSHPDLKLNIIPYNLRGDKTLQTVDLNKDFYLFPQMNPVKNLVAYACLSDETLLLIQQRQKTTQPIPDPDPLQMIRSDLRYNLCLSDTVSGKNLVFSLSSNPNTIKWSPDGSSLALALEGSGLENPKIMVLLADINNVAALNVIPNDIRAHGFSKMKWSPDGSKIMFPSSINFPAASGGPGADVFDTLMIVDVRTGSLINIPENNSKESIHFGDWLDDSNIIFPHRGRVNGKMVVVTKENISSFVSEKVFEDTNFNWPSFIDLSPDKKYLIYSSGYESTTYIDNDLVVRNMLTGESYLVSSFLIGSGAEKRIIKEHQWLADNTLIFSLYGVNGNTLEVSSPEIWKFDPVRKEVSRLLEDSDISKP